MAETLSIRDDQWGWRSVDEGVVWVDLGWVLEAGKRSGVPCEIFAFALAEVVGAATRTRMRDK